jgi:hypothetical protein
MVGFMQKKYFLFLALALLVPLVHANETVSIITNPLRWLTEEAGQFDYAIRVIVLLFSAAIAVIGFKAWQRTPHTRVKWIALAFGLIAFKWVLKVMDMFVSTGSFFPDHAENVIELVSLALIAFAIFAPRNGKN